MDINEHSKEIQELRKQLNQSEQARKVLTKDNEELSAKLKKAQLEATGFRNQILEMQGHSIEPEQPKKGVKKVMYI